MVRRPTAQDGLRRPPQNRTGKDAQWRRAWSRREFCLSAGAAIAGLGLAARGGWGAPATADRPNVLFLFADDLGWSDLGCYGSRYYETPNLDRLAGEGVRFTDAYVNAPTCSPSRAALLTGQYAPRTGCYAVGQNSAWGENLEQWVKLNTAPSTKLIAPDKPLIAQAFKSAGYRTAVFGKWHNGEYREYHPLERGFDEGWVFVKPHNQPRFGPFTTRPQAESRPGQYMCDFTTDNVVAYLSRRHEAPFFLYVPFYAVHGTGQQPAPPREPALLEKYRNKPPHDGDGNAEFAAMVENLDRNVGRILQTLDEQGLRDNTLVVFFSDNGGVGGFSDLGLKNVHEWTSNRPLRGGKYQMREGGVRVPLIVRWPGQTRPGGVCGQPVSAVDFFPTFLEITGGKVDSSHVLDGASLVTLLKAGDDPALKDRAIFWHYPHYYGNPELWGGWKEQPCSAIRKGDYKLTLFYDDNRVELYNVRTDLAETADLSKQLPEKAAALRAELDAWLRAVKAPIPDRRTTPLPIDEQRARAAREADAE